MQNIFEMQIFLSFSRITLHIEAFCFHQKYNAFKIQKKWNMKNISKYRCSQSLHILRQDWTNSVDYWKIITVIQLCIDLTIVSHVINLDKKRLDTFFFSPQISLLSSSTREHKSKLFLQIIKSVDWSVIVWGYSFLFQNCNSITCDRNFNTS